MITSSEFQRLHALTACLPFALDESDEVNAVHIRWRKGLSPDDKRVLDLWTYCFVRRYFLVKFSRFKRLSLADFEEVLTIAYNRIEESRASIADAGKYTQWVSVVCKNTFLSHARTIRTMVPLADVPESCLAVEDQASPGSHGYVTRALSSAIERLPESLQQMSRMRFVERQSYEQIAEVTGRPLPTIRAYIGKAMNRFRGDNQFREDLEILEEQEHRA